MAEEIKNGIAFGEEFDQGGFGLIEDGKYEVKLEKIEQKVGTQSGKKYLNLTFTIRSDIDQKFKNRKLFYTIGAKPGDACYDFQRINKLVLTQKDTPNYKKSFMDFDEVLLYLNGINLVLTVETQFDDYRGEDRNVVKDWSFEPSMATATADTSKESNTTKLEAPTGDELPF